MRDAQIGLADITAFDRLDFGRLMGETLRRKITRSGKEPPVAQWRRQLNEQNHPGDN